MREDYVKCPRCRGKGEIVSYWNFDASDPLVREGKKRTEELVRCPVCNGSGEVYDPAAEARVLALRKSLEEKEKPKRLIYLMSDR